MIKKDEGHNKYERILPIKTDEGHNKYERMLPKLSEVMSDINNIGLSFANKKPSKKNQDDLAEIQNELNRLISEDGQFVFDWYYILGIICSYYGGKRSKTTIH